MRIGRGKSNCRSPISVWIILSMLLYILPVYGEGSVQLNHALMQAAEKGNLKELQALIGKGADVNAKVKDPAGVDKYDTALTLAYQARHMDVVLELLNKGADINAGWLPPYAEVDIEVYRANLEIDSVYNHLIRVSPQIVL